jgi:hypothetical protein
MLTFRPARRNITSQGRGCGLEQIMSALSAYIHKIHNVGVAARFDELRASSGDDVAIDYAARMLGPNRSKHELKMKSLAAKDKATARQPRSTQFS